MYSLIDVADQMKKGREFHITEEITNEFELE